jgi:hypothetical protein
VILKKRHRLSLWRDFWNPILCFKVIAVVGFTLLLGFVGSILHQNGKILGMDNFEKGERWLENRWAYGDAKAFLFSPQDKVQGIDPTSLAYFGFKRISEKEGINIRPGADLSLDQNMDLEQAAKLFALLDVLDLWPEIIPFMGRAIGKKKWLDVKNKEANSSGSHDFFSRLRHIFGPQYDDRFLFIFVDHLNNVFVKELFDNKEFMRFYVESLERYSRIDYLQAVFDTQDENFRAFLAHKVKSDPFVNIDKELLKLHMFSERLRKRFLFPVTHLYSFLNEFSDTIRLEILARHPLPVEILYLEFNGKRLDLIDAPVILKGKSYQRTMKSETVNFHGVSALQKPTGNPNLILHFRVPGIDFDFVEKVRPFAYQVGKKSDFVLSRLSPAELSNFKGINIEEDKKLITLRATIRIDQNLQIPKGYTVRAGPGTRFELTNFASFISYSPIEFIGNPDNPIIISAGNGGQGFAVLDAEKKSILENVIFKKLSEPRIGSWSLTGAVTFYESSVEMRNVKFNDSKAEDGLNIIRGDFQLEKCVFINSQSDALDVDFGNGKLFQTRFIEAGNDAVDISGSLVEIKNLFVSKAGDKGISLGEKSMVSGENIIIQDTVVGIASKDLSRGDFDRVKIEKSKFGLAVYQKKAIFGPGFLHVKNFTGTELENNWLIEMRSTLKIDGNEIDGKERQLAKLLY